MARAIDASASVRTEASGKTVPAGWQVSHQIWRSVASFAHLGVPAMVIIFGSVLALVATIYSIQQRANTISNAMSDIELVALTVAAEIESSTVSRTPGQGQAFERELPGRVVAHGRNVVVSDRDGRVIGVLPPGPLPTQDLASLLGPNQILTTMAEKAGAMHIRLADGRAAVAFVQNLREPWGQVAVYQPMDAILADWRAQTILLAIMIGSDLVLMAAIAAAFLWQAARARDAATQCDRIGQRMNSALSHGKCGLWEWDIARGRLYFSISMYEMLGLPAQAEALSIGDVNALLHPQDGDLNAMAGLLLANQLDVVDHVFRMRNGAGEWMWIHARAELDAKRSIGGLYLIGIALDITAQKRLEEQTKTADARLAAAIDTISEAFVLWDCENKLVICNSKFLNFLSLPGDINYVGMHYDEVMDRAVLPHVELEIAFKRRPNSFERNYTAQLSDGRWLQINERRTSDGGYVSVGTDITELKKHEEKLMDSERRLIATIADLRRSRQTLEVQARQLAELAELYLEQKAEAEMASRAKSAFLGNMSHELRTPLNAIIGFSEIMEQQTFGALGSPKYVAYTGHIRECGEHLLGIISDVLEMSTLEAGKVELVRTEFNLDEAIASSMRQIEAVVAQKRLTIFVEPHEDAHVCADRNAIEKVLIKILRNAVKFSPEGGFVTVRVVAVGAGVDIFIEDNGPGIGPEDLERIGKPFEQINSPLQNGLKGSGVGLAIARSIAELHGGSLKISSTVGVGTRVCISLPARMHGPSERERHDKPEGEDKAA